MRGRVAQRRRWPDGLQAAVEAKEGLSATAEGEVLDTITVQAFIALYRTVCGMTATAVHPVAPWTTLAALRPIRPVGAGRIELGAGHRAVAPDLDRQPMDHVAQLIAGAAIVVGVDTGLLHLAAACRTPLLGIYCATDPDLTGPMGNGRIEVVGGKAGAPSLAQAIDAAVKLLV